jgi:UDP-N-acetylmuramoyl-L-alanyl-D-glutamate--2,6-diaminopimelate ligase
VRLDGLLHAALRVRGAGAPGEQVERIVGDPAVEVTGVVHDSRAVTRGALFCCIPGERVDGHAFAAAAVDAGASALLCERELPLAVTQVVVRSTREAVGPVAAAFWGAPSQDMAVIGVTGTNGKTTTTHLLRSIFEAAGQDAAVIGTLTGARTTPEAPELQSQLASLRDAGVTVVAMEVSSHALALHRVDGTSFAVGVFTNLSRDHLDFHGSMAEYFAAKASLFAPERTAAAVVNVDDEWGRRLVDTLTIPWQPYALELVDDVVIDATSSYCRWDGVELHVPLGGRFNLSNALGAAVAARSAGVEPRTIAAGIGAAGPVPGRFEAVDAGQPFQVIVDYAHTPDGLGQVLAAAREVAGGHRVHVVFGCGGDRDSTKRAPMGDVAVRLADRVLVTSDNPRSEDPGAIIDDIMRGIPDAGARRAARTLIVERDRRAAIAAALAGAAPGDVVVVAGKGHESTQTIGELIVPFDDRTVARELLEGAA